MSDGQQQPDLFEKQSIADQYRLWKTKPGAGHILKHFFSMTAAYVDEWKKTNVPVSATLIMELVRHKIKHRITRLERMQINAAKWDGYSVYNSFRPHIAREVMSRRPEWQGIFETKELKA